MISNLTTFSGAFNWVVAHGYLVILAGMLVEGPVVTAAAAFASSLGYFDIRIIFILSVLGDLLADVFYYFLGYWGHIGLVEKFGSKVGLTKDRLSRIQNLLHTHAWKTLLALKLTPIIPAPGLMLVGATRMPIRKYISICTIIILPKCALFILLGYFFGSQYHKIEGLVNNGFYAIGIIVVIIILAGIIYKKTAAKIAGKVERL